MLKIFLYVILRKGERNVLLPLPDTHQTSSFMNVMQSTISPLYLSALLLLLSAFLNGRLNFFSFSFFFVVRCFNCRGQGHKAKDCPSAKIRWRAVKRRREEENEEKRTKKRREGGERKRERGQVVHYHFHGNLSHVRFGGHR